MKSKHSQQMMARDINSQKVSRLAGNRSSADNICKCGHKREYHNKKKGTYCQKCGIWLCNKFISQQGAYNGLGLQRRPMRTNKKGKVILASSCPADNIQSKVQQAKELMNELNKRDELDRRLSPIPFSLFIKINTLESAWKDELKFLKRLHWARLPEYNISFYDEKIDKRIKDLKQAISILEGK